MNRKRFLLILIAGLLALTALPGAPARADGLMFVGGTYRQPSMSHINVTIKEKIATTPLQNRVQT